MFCFIVRKFWKSEVQVYSQSDIKSDIKPDIKSSIEADIKSDIKSNIVADIKSDIKSDIEVDIKSDIQSSFFFNTPWSLDLLISVPFSIVECLQSCSHFGVLNLSCTLPSLSYTWVKWSIWEWNVIHNDTNIEKNTPTLRREKHDIYLQSLRQLQSTTF